MDQINGSTLPQGSITGKQKKRRFLFTSRKKSLTGILSDVMGLIALIAALLMVYLSYRAGGEAVINMGSAFLAALFISLIGFILAVRSRQEPDVWYLYSYVGMLLNGAVIILAAVILYIGLA